MKARLPNDETERLAALKAYHILDSETEQSYDDITTLAANICGMPIAAISLVDEVRQWFKSSIGMAQRETAREHAFCAHAILEGRPLVVRDTLKDPRFADNALVTGKPHIRFYAGVPLINQEGLALGTLCVLDCQPRRLSAVQQKALEALARQVIALLELRRVSGKLAEVLEHVKTLHGLLPICAWCKRVRDDRGYWDQVEAFFHKYTGTDFTHGICPDCLAKLKDELQRQGTASKAGRSAIGKRRPRKV